MSAGDTELDQLRRRLRDTELAMERIVAQMANVPLAAKVRHPSLLLSLTALLKKLCMPRTSPNFFYFLVYVYKKALYVSGRPKTNFSLKFKVKSNKNQLNYDQNRSKISVF